MTLSGKTVAASPEKPSGDLPVSKRLIIAVKAAPDPSERPRQDSKL